MNKERASAEAGLKQQLQQIALELAAASAASQSAAEGVDDPRKSWVHVQQLLTRFDQAAHLMGEFRRQVDELVKSAATSGDAARLAEISRTQAQ